MPDYYTAFFDELRGIEAAVRETEHACVELPPTVARELYNGVVCYMKADKEFSEGNEEKASEELQKALKHASQASADMLKFRFMFYPKFAHSAINEFKEYKERHKEISPEYLPDCDENIENLSEIVTLAKNTKSPRETPPEIKDTYRKRIRKLLDFSIHFKKAREWGQFSTGYSRLKTHSLGVPDNYAPLKHDFSEKFRKTEEAMEATKEVGENFLPHVAEKLYHGAFSYIKADKYLFMGNEEGAVKEIKKAIGNLNQALFDALEFRFLVCLREVRDICTKKIKGNKTVVLDCDSKYSKHFKNLHRIIKNIENRRFFLEEPAETYAYYEKSIENLRDFLDDFEKDEGKLVEAINGRREAVGKGFWRSLGEKVLVAAVIALVGAIVTAGVEYVKNALGK